MNTSQRASGSLFFNAGPNGDEHHAMEVFYLDAHDQKTYVDHSDILNQARVTQKNLRNFPRKFEETCGLPTNH